MREPDAAAPAEPPPPDPPLYSDDEKFDFWCWATIANDMEWEALSYAERVALVREWREVEASRPVCGEGKS